MASLLNTLMESMLSQEGTQALAGKANADTNQVQQVVQNALPVLMQSMVNNASSEQGATALSSALNAHSTKEGNIIEQLAGADTEDGAKILGHLLGDKNQAVMDKIGESSNLSSSQVGSILSSLAPVLLSSVGKQTSSAGINSGNDLSRTLMGLIGGGGSSSGESSGGGILDFIMKDNDGDGKSDVLTSLMGMLGGK